MAEALQNEMLTVEVKLHSHHIPMWMPLSILEQMYDEIAEESRLFVESCHSIRTKYEQMVRQRVGGNVVPFSKGGTVYG